MDKVNGIKILKAQGNHDYWHSETAPPTDGNYWGNVLFTFNELQDNPISGLNPYIRVPDDYPNDPHSPGSDDIIS